MKPKIEVEYRALLSNKQYLTLLDFLSHNGKDLGADNKDVYFFLLPDRIAKVVKNVSNRGAEVVFKSNRLGRGKAFFKEITVPIQKRHFHQMVKIFKRLPFDESQFSSQIRRNFVYKGINIAVKYSSAWKYHCEFEIMVDNISQRTEAKKKISKIAEELNIKIMSEEELSKSAKKIDEGKNR